MATIFQKDTAKALVFVSGLAFDGEAFEDCDLTEEEIDEIIKEIQNFCYKGLRLLNKKYGTISTESTEDIVNQIMFE